MKTYYHKEIEKKWQNFWTQNKVYTTPDEEPGKDNFYLLVEFPYPSGNLHVGHWYAFAVPDILARFLRATGKNVLFPIGFDAFGLPAENAAIKRNLNPRTWTEENIAHMTDQIRSMGASFDWTRTVSTIDPKYYKWTQWLFLQFYNKGLVYEKETAVNWCPNDKTVLANEQVVNGKCERCGHDIEQRNMLQWNIKITDYADRLVDDLAALDWPEQIKESQRNWIGRSEGAEIDFAISDGSEPITEVVFASNNSGKLLRMQKLFAAGGLSIQLKTPKDIGVSDFDVVEDGATLRENAEKKARALAAKTSLPVLSDDSGFFIRGSEVDPVTVKRNALTGLDEKSLSVEEIGKRMQDYYASIATQYGGRVDAEWHNALCLVMPDKTLRYVETIRPVILTNESHGRVDPHLPLRGLYISAATNKYVLEQTEAEELEELRPITVGLQQLLRPAITVFTTRPDTLFGATYLVIAPEHPLAKSSLDRDVQKYVAQANRKTELERQESKEKTGVRLNDINAINPATKEEIPIWVADYVLGSYGTGAIMAVPAHDERDFEFAKKFSLPIRRVIEPKFYGQSEESGVKEGLPLVKREAVCVVLRNPKNDTYLCNVWKGFDMHGLLTGGIEKGEDVVTAAQREIREESGYKNVTLVQQPDWVINTFFYHRQKKENRWARFHILFFDLDDEARDEIPAEENAKHEFVWKKKDGLQNFFNVFEGDFVAKLIENQDFIHTEAGIVGNSGEFDGLESHDAAKKITEKFGRPKKTYRLRDWVVSRQRYWGVPIPIIHCEKCGPVPVPENQLPVLLPDVEDYLPTGDGKSPLAKVKSFVETTCPKCGGEGKRETDTFDTFVDSSWYFLRYTDPTNAAEFASKEKLATWMPVDLYSGGAEHTTMHVLYSRFWQKALYDLGLVKDAEPYTRRMNRSIILGPDGQKMSKSHGNVIDPDEVVARLGADTVRMYLAFIGPYNEVASYPWNPDGVTGVRRFLERVWKLGHSVHENPGAERVDRALHQAIKKVTEDIPKLKFNTAIAALMGLVNAAEKDGISKAQFELLLRILAPFAPHITEELWQGLGHSHSIHAKSWPEYDPALVQESEVTYAIQIDGKTRGDVTVPAVADKAAVEVAAREAVRDRLADKTVARVVVVPGRLVNFVLVK